MQDLLEALELAQSGKWHEAHDRLQNQQSEFAYWIHAALHLEEGDTQNAKYWFTKAGRTQQGKNFQEEYVLIESNIKKLL